MFSDAFLNLARQRRVNRPVIDDGVIRVFCLQTGTFGTNAYVVIDQESGQSLLIDAPGDAAYLMAHLVRAEYLLLTHNHFDHTGALVEIKDKLEISIAAHTADAAGLPVKPDIYLEGGETLDIGETKLAVIHTPGHSPGGLSFLVGDYLFSGDTIFPGGPGYTDSPGSFRMTIETVTTKIFTLPSGVRILPGHGDATTVAEAAAEYAAFAARVHAPGLCGEVTWANS